MPHTNYILENRQLLLSAVWLEKMLILIAINIFTAASPLSAKWLNIKHPSHGAWFGKSPILV